MWDPNLPWRPPRELSLKDGGKGGSKLRPTRLAGLEWLMVAEKGHLVRRLTGAKEA